MLFELSLSIVSFLVASYFIIVSFSLDYKNPVLAENSVFFPFFVSIFLIFLGLIHLIYVLKKHKYSKKNIDSSDYKNGDIETLCQVVWSKDVFIYIGIIAVYLILLPFTGYLPTSIAFCISYLFIYKMKIKSKISVITAFIIPVGIWAIFRFALKVALP